MFKRHAAGQRIFPSEPAAPSLPRPVPEGQAAPSKAAELAYCISITTALRMKASSP
jgi:hypothetical protein